MSLPPPFTRVPVPIEHAGMQQVVSDIYDKLAVLQKTSAPAVAITTPTITTTTSSVSGSASGSGGGSGILLEVNGIKAVNQTLLNLVQGNSITIKDDPLGAGDITFTGAVGGINEQTGSYTILFSDRNSLVILNSASAKTFTLPATPPDANWIVFVQNIGAGILTLSPNGRNIDGGASSLTLFQNDGLIVFTDGTNYFTCRGMGTVNKYSTTFSSANPWVVTHNLGTTAVIVAAYDGSGNLLTPTSVVITSANVVTITFGSSQSGSAVVIG